MKSAATSALLLFLGIAAILTSLAAPGRSAVADDVAAISSGYRHNCVLTSSSGIKCWGDNSSGQLGDGTTSDRRLPVDVPSLMSGIAVVDGGDSHTCAVTTEGQVKCWGRNELGQLGIGTNSDLFGSNPNPLDTCANELCEEPLSNIVDVSTGDSHTCALTEDATVKCWGLNDHGQLGGGTLLSTNTPIDVVGLDVDIVAVEAGAFHTCALTVNGGVKCWGKNGEGQLGDGRECLTDCPTPVDVVGLGSGVAMVMAAGLHTCAVTTGGGVQCWGFNFDGQLGNGSEDFTITTPVQVTGLDSGVVSIAANGIFRGHACALLTTGGVKCWGDNAYGQLGDNSTVVRLTPVDVVGLASGVAALSAGNGHTCALMIAGGVKCWGDNAHGRLGDGTVEQRNTPVDTLGLKATQIGDVNCDFTVNSIDATILLQLNAALIDSIPCSQNADANGDGAINSIDAQLILQFTAGLFPTLPP